MVGDDGLQLLTIVGPVVTGLQVVATHELPEVAGDALQVATGVGPVDTLVGQVVVVQFGAEGPDGVHEATPVTGLTRTGQVVVVQLLPELAALGTQLPLATVVALTEQVVDR